MYANNTMTGWIETEGSKWGWFLLIIGHEWFLWWSMFPVYERCSFWNRF